MMKHRHARIDSGAVAEDIIAWLVTLVSLIPLLLVVFTSFKSGTDAKTLSFSLPETWDFTNFATVIEKGKLGEGFLNSLTYAGIGSVITIFFAAMAAYVFSRNRSRGNRFLYTFVVLGIVMPINYVSLMKVMQFLSLNDSRLGMIFLYTAIQMPFMVFLIYGFVGRLPTELDEAAVIDGCNPLRLFFSIIFPLMKPILTTAVVLCFLNMWNEFVLPLYFLNDTAKWPMSLAVYNFFGRYSREWNLICADVLLTSLPVVILYLLCQKQIVGGQTAGAVKG